MRDAVAVEMQAHALRLLDRGFSLIPVPSPRAGVPMGEPGDGKTPAIAWREFQHRLPTVEEIARWFTQPMNVAVVTGAVSGVVAIDADAPDALLWCTKHLPYTPWQTQTAHGFHLWYRHPGVRVPNRVRLNTRDGQLPIDVRADGGFVIAPGSIHATGVAYREAGDWTASRDELPVFWPGWVARPNQSKPSPTIPHTRPTGDRIERARRYLRKIPCPDIGSGSDNATMFAACRLVRGFDLSPSDAEALLWEWAGGRPGWTRDWIAQKVASACKYATEPLGGYL
jgi:hypothetical protein